MQMYNYASRPIGQGKKKKITISILPILSILLVAHFLKSSIWANDVQWNILHLIWCTDEFARAVYVATGLKLSQHLVNIVFEIFDVDHDDQLSYKEFIGIMKDRLHRGSWVNGTRGSAAPQLGLFKHCLSFFYSSPGDSRVINPQSIWGENVHVEEIKHVESTQL